MKQRIRNEGLVSDRPDSALDQYGSDRELCDVRRSACRPFAGRFAYNGPAVGRLRSLERAARVREVPQAQSRADARAVASVYASRNHHHACGGMERHAGHKRGLRLAGIALPTLRRMRFVRSVDEQRAVLHLPVDQAGVQKGKDLPEGVGGTDASVPGKVRESGDLGGDRKPAAACSQARCRARRSAMCTGRFLRPVRRVCLGKACAVSHAAALFRDRPACPEAIRRRMNSRILLAVSGQTRRPRRNSGTNFPSLTASLPKVVSGISAVRRNASISSSKVGGERSGIRSGWWVSPHLSMGSYPLVEVGRAPRYFPA